MTVTSGKRSLGMLSLMGNMRQNGCPTRVRGAENLPRLSPGSERPAARLRLRHVLVGVIGGAHERSGRDVVEAERVGGLFERHELVRVPVAHDRQVAL